MKRAFLCTLAEVCAAGLAYKTGHGVSRQSRLDAETGEALYECKNAIRPLLGGIFLFDRQKTERADDGYVIHLDVWHQVADEGVQHHVFVCNAVVEDGRQRARSVAELP